MREISNVWLRVIVVASVCQWSSTSWSQLPQPWKDDTCLPDPATIKFEVALTEIICLDDTDGGGDDDTYAVIAAANMKPSAPTRRVYRTRIMGMGTGERKELDFVVWGPSEQSPQIPHPDQLVILVALMDNDDGDPELVRGLVEGGSGTNRLNNSYGLTPDNLKKYAQHERQTMLYGDGMRIRGLIEEMNLAIKYGSLGVLLVDGSDDDHIDTTKELRVAYRDLVMVHYDEKLQPLVKSNPGIHKWIDFSGHGGRYRLSFELRPPSTSP